MDAIFFIVGGLITVVWLVRLISANAGNYDAIVKLGQPALGILLRVDSQSYPVTGGSFPVEGRDVTIEVELPGQIPFELRVRALAPTNLRSAVLPGATVELRVDRTKPKAVGIAIVGPGAGFSVTAAPGTTS